MPENSSQSQSPFDAHGNFRRGSQAYLDQIATGATAVAVAPSKRRGLGFLGRLAPAIILPAAGLVVGASGYNVETASASTDFCPDNATDPNTWGPQLTLPPFYKIVNGQCVPEAGTPIPGTPIGETPHPITPHPVTDACPDVPGDPNTYGNSLELPPNYEIRGGLCVPKLSTPIPGTPIGETPHPVTPHPVTATATPTRTPDNTPTATATPTATPTSPLVDVCLSKNNLPSPEFDYSVPFGWTRDAYGNCYPPLIQTPTATFTLTPTPTATPGVCDAGVLEIDKIHVDRSKDKRVGDKPMSASFNVDDTSTGPGDDFSMTTSEVDGIARKVVRGGVTYILGEVPREGFEEIDKKSVQKAEVGCGSVKKVIFRNSEIPAGQTPVPTPTETRPVATPQVPVSGNGLANVDVTTRQGKFNFLGFGILSLAGLAISGGLFGRERAKSKQ